MKRSHLSTILCLTPLVLTLWTAAPVHAEASDDAWPSFRGPHAQGIADGQGLPTTFDVKSSKNVRWRTAIPGLGHSSPVVWGEQIFVTTAESTAATDIVLGDEGGIDLAEDSTEHVWKILAIHPEDGRILWTREAHRGVPGIKRHVKASQVNATPATDGKTLAAVLGPQRLFAFDMDGTVRWSADLGTLDPGLFGDPTSQWGHASSPIVVGNRVIVQVDRHENSFLAAYDAKTGQQIWRVERDERPIWATPTYFDGAGRQELIVMGGYFNRGYRLEDGKEIWRVADDAQVKTPTAFVAGDRIILGGGYRGRPLFAVRTGGEGDLTPPEGAETGGHILWRTEAGGPYTSTPIAYGEHLFSVTDKGILNVYELATGKRLHRVRTDEHFSASPVASDGHLYFAGEGGTLLVVAAGPELEIVAQNTVGESLMATPAIAHGTLYVRSSKALYAIATVEEPTKPEKSEDQATSR